MAHEMHMGDDGILRVKFSGDFEEGDVAAYMKDFSPFLEAATEKVHFLVDVSEVGKASGAARRTFAEIFQEPHPLTGNSALIGVSRYLRVLIGFVLKATGATNLRIFDSEEEALAWLQEIQRRERQPA